MINILKKIKIEPKKFAKLQNIITKLQRSYNEKSTKISKLKSKLEIAEEKITKLEIDKNEMKKEMNRIKTVIYNIQLKKDSEIFLKLFDSILNLNDRLLLGNAKS